MSNDAQAYSRSAIALARQGRLAEAATAFEQALWLKPDDADTLSNLGNIHFLQGNSDAAIGRYRQALAVRPEFGGAHYNLGVALQQRGQLDEAMVCYRRAVALECGHLDAHVNLGNALKDLGRFDEAIACYQQVLQLQPNFAEVHVNLGIALGEQQHWDEAISCYHHALRLKPTYVEAHTTLGIAMTKLGRFDEAMQWYDKALGLQGDNEGARWNRALLLLMLGDFKHGWPEYEWRWAEHKFARRQFAQPLWDERELRGRSILIHAEQGLGDTLQFIRYLPMVRDRGGRTIVECQAKLVPLLAEMSGIDQLVPRETPLPHFDVQAPLLSLPGIFRTTLDTIPAAVPYLHADSELVNQWREILHDTSKTLRIGIAWQGSKTNTNDRLRSIPLAHFGRLAAVPGVQLVSLQQGWGTEQMRDLKGQFAVLDLEGRRGEDSLSFANVAAIMKNLDLVVCCDTSMAHLAGALGVPVWIGLQFAHDWRWLLNRDDSPWYPSARLFRQARPNDWEGVFERMAQALEVKVAAK
ncbi:MAG TPA: tetratricopeptide repeat-containing glycosyltransferase family protein [Gemmataceae bacterium]|nr:tetratricopeptide repeat-containing glycosyltransferase family protein [Gemmataceae bacterium]